MDEQEIERFFISYASDLASGSGERIAANYDLPSFLVMTPDAPGRAITDRVPLAESFAGASNLYRQHDFGDPLAHVTRTEQITSSVLLAWVTWEYRDTSGRPIYDANYLYALRISEGRFFISCVFSINEQERLADWLERRNKHQGGG